MKQRLFFPEAGSSKPEFCVAMARIIGGGLDGVHETIGDHAWRAQWLSNSLSAVVLAFEQEPARREEDAPAQAVKTAKEIDKAFQPYADLPVVLAGASYGAFTQLEVARTQAVSFDYLSVFDPIGTVNQKFYKGFSSWARHQLREEPRKPAETANQHPIPPQQPWSTLTSVASAARTFDDIARNTKFWRHRHAFLNLYRLAVDSDYESVGVQAWFPGHTFTAPQGQAAVIAARLDAARPATAPAPFEATYVPEWYHSYTDDPDNFSRLVEKVVSL